MELGPKQTEWLEALESGKWPQSDSKLGGADRGYCCLGVALCIIYPKLRYESYLEDTPFEDEGESSEVDIPFSYGEIGLKSEGGSWDSYYDLSKNQYLLMSEYNLNASCLIDLNDAGMPFEKIAEFIRDYPESIFAESK